MFCDDIPWAEKHLMTQHGLHLPVYMPEQPIILPSKNAEAPEATTQKPSNETSTTDSVTLVATETEHPLDTAQNAKWSSSRNGSYLRIPFVKVSTILKMDESNAAVRNWIFKVVPLWT
jgi:hypothetical protein